MNSKVVIPQFVYLRSVTMGGIKGYIETAEPYCDKHFRETKEICKDDIVLAGNNTDKKPCILCVIGA